MSFQGNQHLPGLHPVTSGVAGTAPRINHYDVSATYAATIAEGCIALKDALGANLAAASGTAELGGVMGVFAHNLKATPGAGARVAIYDDPQQEFVGVLNAAMTSTAAIEAIGQYIGCVSNTYNATLGQGKLLLSTATLTSVRTTTVYLQVIGIVQPVGETLASTYATLRVKIADGAHMLSSYDTSRVTA